MKNNNVCQPKTKEEPIQKVEEQNEAGDEADEDLENDIYLLELHKRLTAMKNERKKAQQDEVLLRNRLNLLKGEEEKVKTPLMI